MQYTSKGERKHVSFADEGYGPDFGQLAVVLKKYSLEPVVICESRETQAEDAAAMRDLMREAIAQSRRYTEFSIIFSGNERKCVV